MKGTVNIEEYQELQSDFQDLKGKYEAMKFEFEKLLDILTRSKSERYQPAEYPEQLCLPFVEEDEQQAPSEEEEITYKRHKKKHPGRTELPEHLPVEETIIEPEEDTTDMTHIGDEITETIDYEPGRLVKKRYIRRKYARKKELEPESNDSSENNTSEVVIGQLPERPIPKSIAEAGLLAYLFVAKYVDHLPFYRQRQQLKRNYDWVLHQSTLNDWFAACCTLIDPLYEVLIEKALDTDYLQADESPIKVQDSKKKGKTHQGYMWVYRNHLTGLVLFDYRKGRGMDGPQERLENFRGTLQCDGYKVYESIAAKRKEGVIELVSCLAHIRRKFYDAQNHYPELADYALKLIRSLYMLERRYREEGLEPKQIASRRKKEAAPLLDELIKWVNKNQPRHLSKGPIGKALVYAKGQLPKLKPYLEDGRIQIDNNLIENQIRPLALGRKNYLFAGSHKGAQRAAMMYSFFASCKTMDVNPLHWLRDTLKKIPTTKIGDLDTLLPHNYNSQSENT